MSDVKLSLSSISNERPFFISKRHSFMIKGSVFKNIKLISPILKVRECKYENLAIHSSSYRRQYHTDWAL